MITIETALSLPDGGQCDYCNQDIEPGVYAALTGYELVTSLTPEHKAKLIFDSLVMHPPFIPCGDCQEFLFSAGQQVEEDIVLALHRKCVDTFNTYYHSEVPYPTIRMVSQ